MGKHGGSAFNAWSEDQAYYKRKNDTARKYGLNKKRYSKDERVNHSPTVKRESNVVKEGIWQRITSLNER